MVLTDIFSHIFFSLKADFFGQSKKKKKLHAKFSSWKWMPLPRLINFPKLPWRKNNPWSIAGSQGLILEISFLVECFPACSWNSILLITWPLKECSWFVQALSSTLIQMCLFKPCSSCCSIDVLRIPCCARALEAGPQSRAGFGWARRAWEPKGHLASSLLFERRMFCPGYLCWLIAAAALFCHNWGPNTAFCESCRYSQEQPLMSLLHKAT